MRFYFILFITIIFFNCRSSIAGELSGAKIDKQKVSDISCSSCDLKYEDLSTRFQALETDLNNLKNEIKLRAASGQNNSKTLITLSKDIIEVTKQVSLLKDDSEYDQYVGVLLTCVAILVTALGVGIGVLALWGYTNIRDTVTEVALKSSEEQVDVAIRSGKFNEAIHRAVEYVTYRGVMSDDDFPDDSESE